MKPAGMNLSGWRSDGNKFFGWHEKIPAGGGTV